MGGFTFMHCKVGEGEACGESRIPAEDTKQLQAECLARLFAGGLDREIGRDLRGVEAVGVEDPQSENGALMVGAVEIARDEVAYFCENIGFLRI